MEHRTGGKTTIYIVGIILLFLILAIVLGIMTGFIPVREKAQLDEEPVTSVTTVEPGPITTPTATPTPDLSGTVDVPEMTLDEEQQVYTVTVTYGKGGTASPSGMSTVVQKGSMSITILPDEGYEVEDVRVNGNSVGATTFLTLEDVQESYSVYVSFTRVLDTDTVEPPVENMPEDVQTPEPDAPSATSVTTPADSVAPKMLDT